MSESPQLPVQISVDGLDRVALRGKIVDLLGEGIDGIPEYGDDEMVLLLRYHVLKTLLEVFADDVYVVDGAHDSSPTVAAPVLVTPDANTPIVGAGADTPTSARPGPVTPIDGAGAFEGGAL